MSTESAYEDIINPTKRSCSPSYNPMTSELTHLCLQNIDTATTNDDLFNHPFFHPTDLNPWVYRNVLAAAPMVRISTLPFRLGCKAYGANMLYSEELVAKKLATCQRVTNLYDLALDSTNGSSKVQQYNEDIDADKLHVQRNTQMVHFLDPINIDRVSNYIERIQNKDSTTGEYIHQYITPPIHAPDIPQDPLLIDTLHQFNYAGNNKSFQELNTFNTNSVFSTYPHERFVLQLGVGNAMDAVQAVEVVGGDCRAIDINLGCPKLFSTQGLFGSELLTRPEIVEDLIKSIKRNTNLPVTIKIRMLPEAKHTIELIRRAEHCGVEAIAVHCRYKADRPRYQALPLMQLPLLSSIARVPLLYNGDIYSHHEIEQYKHISRGCWCTETVYNEEARQYTINCTCGSNSLNAKGVQGVLIGRGAMHNPAVFGHYLLNPGHSWAEYNQHICSIPDPLPYHHSTTISTPPSPSPIPPADQVWDPIQRLLIKQPICNYYLHQPLYDEYRTQFTQPSLMSQRNLYHHKHQEHRFEPYEYPPQRIETKYTPSTSEYRYFNPSKPRLQMVHLLQGMKDEDYHLFWKDTWPLVNGDYYKPTVSSQFDELLKEIDQGIVLRETIQQDIEKQSQNILLTQQAGSNATFETSPCDQPQDNLMLDSDSLNAVSDEQPIEELNCNDQIDQVYQLDAQAEKKLFAQDDWALYEHRTPPYQYSNPALNPTHHWEFNQSYTQSKLMIPNSLTQPRTIPSFYPTALVGLAFSLLNNLTANSKYTISSMIKHSNQITKDPVFRLCHGAKTNPDLLEGIYKLRHNNSCKANFFHPQVVTKHEPRPLPKKPSTLPKLVPPTTVSTALSSPKELNNNVVISEQL